MAHCGSRMAAVDPCTCHKLWLRPLVDESALCERCCGEISTQHVAFEDFEFC